MLDIDFTLIRDTAKIPTRAHDTDAGLDLYAAESATVMAGSVTSVSTGFSLLIPPGYVGLIWPRSGMATKNGIDTMAGVIDAGYTGEIIVALTSHDDTEIHSIEIGDKIAQLLIQPIPAFTLNQVSSLPGTTRAKAGFGSTGR